MSNGNSSTGGGYNYYQSSDLQAYQQSTSYNQANSYYDPAAIAIANATGNMAGHHHHQIGSNSGYNHHSKSIDPNFDANVAAQQSIYTPDATAIHHQQIQNQQQNQQNQQQQQPSQQANQKLNKGKARTTIIRKAGGEVWEDQTLMEWDPAHFRLFVGDLAPEVSDDGLAAAFSKWSSFVKARVVRDKVTTKSKGYGFVSYKDPEDFMKAWKEMNGKYVGSRPIKISKATTKVGVVQIGNKKARALDDHRKKKLIQGVERLRTGAGAVWKNDNRPYARR
ncbi:hypothetical protein Pst134EA_005516 [Puccinia striiformis f. sp. tritici]|uniref:RRM domain-containing protein n=2 Tax=Puccinia striiformis TaxID=27350 RepID=A0A0L0UYY9_9BASI|nr:hypothetical protein Pst134EA_005516 [Puccinia striiformis f. sp. tritici]KAI9628450.1 hypothetical protein KEM48_011609 [Puccinia striiformis f. sp. tritici PST-130]KNE92272.1 hypothetical protein PSTG_14366 [Puccinia striiformis f. sp. tritici PST-78]POW18797.1 hypothetical protein PSHT_05419 [Puccinia striiformis]KAH9462718.1 hypothetical protein Pst134EB_006595 [Puccinia striiformis f. sp. tritici]KAH9471629.1 hypothetical protein Pst134EA_005516 [Puccinia striiformis f. sp. tritici]